MDQFYLPRTPDEAASMQDQLLMAVKREVGLLIGEPSIVAGVDVSYGKAYAYACIVCMRYRDLTSCSCAEARSVVRFPYLAGYFAFREIPPVLEAYPLVARFPDLLLVHGHGYSHPRRIGLATHLGFLLHVPTIGIAGRGMKGMEVSYPGSERGSGTPVRLDGEVVGTLLRTRAGSPPVFISAGFRTNLAQAENHVLHCCRNSRFPEPLVLADRGARMLRRRCEG